MAVLVALIGTMAAGGIRTGARVWERADAEGAAEWEALALRRFLADLLASALPVRVRDGTRAPPVLWRGGPDALVLAARLPSHLAPPGEQLVELALRPGREGVDLVMRWEPLGPRRPRAAPGPGAAEERLATGLASARFLYEGAERWEGRPTLPRAVSLDLAWPDARAWPALVVAPPLAAAGAGG